MKRIKVYTDWLDWGIGISYDANVRVLSVDFLIWDVDIDLAFVFVDGTS